MNRFISRRSVISVLMTLTLIAAFAGGVFLLHGGGAQASGGKKTTKSVFCQYLGKKFQASSGAQMYCFGRQPNGPTKHVTPKSGGGGLANVNAANPSEDVSPVGVQAYGQSETSIAGVRNYAVEAWNDATGFFSTCGAAQNKEELTGFGFSSDGGTSFTDLGGLPNNNCNANIYGGDPSVEGWNSGGHAYFYISSLFNCSISCSDPRSHIAMAACAATGAGSSAALTCSQPIIVASSSMCSSDGSFCSFLDKDFLSIDPAHGLLYATYTEFFFNSITFVQTSTVELAVCDIGNGALGGTPAAPVCVNGAVGSSTAPSAPYFVVAVSDPNGCENEGGYPAVDVATGDVYVAYEHNWATSLFVFPGDPCATESVQNVMNFIPASCLTLPTSCGAPPTATRAINITSLEGAFIPGYNRFPMNDFPRLAVSHGKGVVSMVWNDARNHPSGDILLQSMNLTTLAPRTGAPVQINADSGGWHFLPALRNTNSGGFLNVSWYSRFSANTSFTDVTAAFNLNPLVLSTPAFNTLVTNISSDWNAVSSDIVPNFGDYTDNYTIARPNSPFTGSKDFVAWADGRIGDPQPFEANKFT